MGVAEQVRAVVARWDEGLLARGEVVSAFAGILTPTNIDEVVAAVPDEWRADLVEHLRRVSEEGPLMRVFAGIRAYELEGDPVRRAAMEAEVDRQRAEEVAYFENVVRPAIRAWLRQRT